MFCSNCGNKLIDGSNFCGKCGATAFSDSESAKPNFELSKVFSILGFVLIGITLLGAGAMAVVGNSPDASIGSIIGLIVNWMLALLFLFAVLGLFGAVPLGIVFLSRARQRPKYEDYYKRNALWALIGPALFIFGIIIAYIIVQIVARFVGFETLN